jgi:hypothetical protein
MYGIRENCSGHQILRKVGILAVGSASTPVESPARLPLRPSMSAICLRPSRVDGVIGAEWLAAFKKIVETRYRCCFERDSSSSRLG